MKYINSQIKNILKVILSVMIVFSSILVINPNSLLAEGETQETVVKQEEVVEKQDEVIEQEIIEEKQDETIIEEVKEETSSENVDVVQGEAIVEEETLTEEVTDEIETVEKAPKTMAFKSMLGAEQTYTVTIKDGLKTLKTITVTANQPIPAEQLAEITYNGKNPEDRTAVFYWREYRLLSYEEHIWDLTSPVTKNLTLYVKFLDIDSTSEFDFRVKHKDSKELTDFRTGSYVSVGDDGYTYSYYKYETGIEFSYDEGESGETFEGSSFDLAIQESNPGDTIQLLKDRETKEPITIWSDVNFDLNGKKIEYKTSLITKIINFINYFWKKLVGTDRKIIPIQDDFNPVIFVFNARTTISNGTITNSAGGSGHGVVVYSSLPEYVAKLEDLTINAYMDADAVSSGYEGKIENSDNPGEYDIENAKGAVVINGGEYSGNIYNYNSEGSLTINGGKFNKNPILNTNAVLGTDRYLYYNKSEKIHKYKVSDYSYQAVIVDTEGNEISNTTLVSALGSVIAGQTIKLVQDVSLNGDLAININGRSFDIDVNGHNITSTNNSKINISDNAAGEVRFINSSTNYTGHVDVPIVVNSGIAIIENGYYYSATNAKVRGGYFVESVSCLYDNNYICNELDRQFLDKYNYNVVLKDELYVAKNETTGTKYTSLAKAIEKANANENITILQNIYLTETISIDKSLTISLPANGYDIYSFAQKSFEIIGQGTVVTFNGTTSAGNTITNNFVANNEDVEVFEVNSGTQLVINNISVNVETQNSNKLVAINCIGVNTSVTLNATTINIANTEFLNKNIIAIESIKKEENDSNPLGSKISMNVGSYIKLEPSSGCLKVIGICNSVDNNVINIDSSYVVLNAVGNKTDNIDYYGLLDDSSNSNILLNAAYVSVTNDRGNSYGINVTNTSKLDVLNSSIVALTVMYDNSNDHCKSGIFSNGVVNIDGSSISSSSTKSNINTLHISGGKAYLKTTRLDADSTKQGICVMADNEGYVSIEGKGNYHYIGVGNIINCNNATVEISGGNFSDDITEWLKRNYKCIYDSTTNDYKVDYSDCELGFTVANDGTLVINYKIIFDKFMLDNENKYGVRFISTDLPEYNNLQFSIADTKKNGSYLDGKMNVKFEDNLKQGVYSFAVPARLMGATIGLQIIDLETGHLFHRKNEYSVKEYYYDILSTIDEKTGEYVYSAAMRDLAAAALNFGAYCQELFKEETDANKLVNAQVDEYSDKDKKTYTKGVTDAYDEEIEGQKATNTNTGDLIDDFVDREHSLVLEESTTLRFRFNMAKDASDISKYKAYYRNASINGSKFIEIKPFYLGNTYCLDIPGIKSYNYDNKFELKIEKDGVSCLITYRPLDYVFKEFKEAAGKILAEALYTYYKISNLYYGGLR